MKETLITNKQTTEGSDWNEQTTKEIKYAKRTKGRIYNRIPGRQNLELKYRTRVSIM